MFSLVRSFFGHNQTSTDDEFLDSAFDDETAADESESEDGASEPTHAVTDDFDRQLEEIMTEKVDNKTTDNWNDDWNAFDEEITPEVRNLLTSDSRVCSANGVVTHILNDNQIRLNNELTIRYDKCNIVDLTVGDVVCVDKKDNEVVVKPHRYMIRTGKVTDYDKGWNRWTFCKYAYISRKCAPVGMRVGDVLKCLVIETQNQGLHWRAYPYTEALDPTTSDEDKVESFTNELTDNKNGIELTSKVTFDRMKLNATKKVFVWIRNKTKNEHILESVDNEEGEHQIRFHAFHRNYGHPIDPPFKIPPNKEVFVELICEAQYCGDHSELIVFKFEGFKIGRFCDVTVLDMGSAVANGDESANKNRCNNTGYRRNRSGAQTWIVPGEKIWPQNKHIIDRLPDYRVPGDLWRTLENNWPLEDTFPEISNPLTKENYRKKFHTLLYMEEIENENCLKKYNMHSVRFKQEGRYLSFSVPGLADGRPSLIMGDRVIIFEEMPPTEQRSTEKKRIGYEGFIHEIRRDDVMVRFNEELHREFGHNYTNSSFKVEFRVSRMVFRRCHHAIDLAPYLVDQVLFPTSVIMKPSLRKVPISAINWFNPSLNIRQKLAVVGALSGECRPTPYIIFGPPGTGKTVTIVESILQVFDKLSHSRIIACTSANCSADLIVQKLLESGRVTSNDLIRITALHRVNQIPEEVQCVTKVADEDPKKWLYHRIIVTTTSQAGIVFRHKIAPSHFTHVFIDEAGQVTEPESLIPITMCGIGHGMIVLAGDHNQLGPVVQNQRAKTAKLDRSLIERLMTCFQTYHRNDKFKKYGFYNPKFVVKLVDNYRSDEQIMAIPSKLFYESELIFHVSTDHKLLVDAKLNAPINFVGVKGEDRQDADCPSWYNPHEIIVTCSYLDRLYDAGVKPEDIGVLTPYRKQVTKIREHIHDMGIMECRVATIEEFQGLEKRVIIVSMVRSVDTNLEHDLKYNLGFIHNAKRFNVAVSRAMSVLVVVGNPNLLVRDRNWKALIAYCLQHECYSGCDFQDYVRPKQFKQRLLASNPA